MGNARGRTCLPGRIGLDAWPNQPLRHFIRRRYQRNISRPFQRQVSSRRRPFANQAATKKPRQSQASVSVLRPYLRGGVTCGLAGCSSVTWTHASRTLVGQQLVRCFSKTAGLARARCTVPAAPLADDASVGVQLLTLLCFYTAPRPAVITKMRESQRSYPYHLFHQSYAPIIRAAAHADAPPIWRSVVPSQPTMRRSYHYLRAATHPKIVLEIPHRTLGLQPFTSRATPPNNTRTLNMRGARIYATIS